MSTAWAQMSLYPEAALQDNYHSTFSCRTSQSHFLSCAISLARTMAPQEFTYELHT